MNPEARAGERTSGVHAPASVRRSTAGRLLNELFTRGALVPKDVASALRTTAELLEACAAGRATLPHETQLRLAALVTLWVPEYEAKARRLFAQAQAALRVEANETASHLTYPITQMR